MKLRADTPLLRIVDQTFVRVLKSGEIWNNCIATKIIHAEIDAFISDLRYDEWREGLAEGWYSADDVAEQLASECVFQLKLTNPNRVLAFGAPVLKDE